MTLLMTSFILKNGGYNITQDPFLLEMKPFLQGIGESGSEDDPLPPSQRYVSKI